MEGILLILRPLQSIGKSSTYQTIYNLQPLYVRKDAWEHYVEQFWEDSLECSLQKSVKYSILNYGL